MAPLLRLHARDGGARDGGGGGGGADVDAHSHTHAHAGLGFCLEDGTPLPIPLWPWLQQQRTPVLMLGIASGWPLRRWTNEALERNPATAALPVQVRWHRVPVTATGAPNEDEAVVMEGDGWFEATTLGAACRVARDPQRRPASTEGTGTDGGDVWTAYVSYHHLHDLLGNQPDRLSELDWMGTFGVPSEPDQCAFWLGSPRAHTPCHLDTYGCNIAVQLDGRKRWTLFPPAATAGLWPTRVPYEESTVFSRRANLPSDLDHVAVTLEPGDALFVPHQWWHWVECLEPAVSVNHWLALPEDAAARVHEAVVRYVVGTFVRGGTASPTAAVAAWLNPGETVANDPTEEVELLSAVLGDTPTELVQPALLRALTHPDIVARVVDLLRADLNSEPSPRAKRARVA